MKKTSLLFLLSLVFSFYCLFYLEPSKAKSAQEPTRLFDLIGAKRTQSRVSVAAVREQEIAVNFASINFETVQKLDFPLLDGESYKAVRRESEGFVRFADDEFTWRGKIFGDDGWSGDVILSVKGEAMSGLIYSPRAVYEIVPQENFKHLLVEIDQSQFPPCGGAIPAKPKLKGTEGNRRSLPGASALDDGSLIDVLVVYTGPVRAGLGGTTQTRAFIQQAIASTNTAYQNSGINPRLRLVNTLEVDYDEDGTLSSALDWVRDDATVAAARNTSKADLVAILVEDGDDACGRAGVMQSVGPEFSERAFSATKRSCAVGNLTFAHELGHNQGCEHNPENGASPESASYPYAFGHYVNNSFRTIMSSSDPCSSGCARVAHFSNPSVTFNGRATGIANQRDNHRVINNTALIVSQFRDSGGGNSCSSTSINVGQTLNGSLTSSDCVLSGTGRRYDVYSFNGQAGQGIAVSMDSSAFDTYLYLTNSANQILDEDNNSGPGTNSRIPNSSGVFTLPATGSYFLRASSASDNATGAYSISLTGCTYSLSTNENQVGPGAGSTNIFMDALSGCAWSADSDSTSWLTTSSLGTGAGTISYNYTSNTSTSPRTGRITVGGQVHTVTQIGVGGAGSVRFSSATYNANEGGGDVTITVNRSGGTGTGTVQYSTSNGTATAGVDYVSTSGTLLFGGNETSKSFTITILDDATFEGNESFSLSLNNNSSSFTLGNPSTATLAIIDNDMSPDSTGPGLSINSHSNGDTISNSSISLSGTASDSGRGDNGISSVTVNGVAASGGTASGSGTANWNHTLTLNQGANTVTVVARDNSSNQNNTTQSITLHYQPAQTYTIAVSASPSSGGTVGGGGTFVAGGSRTVTASANSGYSFANWTENGGVVSSSTSYTFTLNSNRTLVANFSIVSSGNAAYDSTLKAPKCPVPGSVCDSGTLINGRGNITGGAEPNQPNTIYNSCADNTVGSYHSDESIDNIRISTLDGSNFAPGKTVKIEVTVWAFSVTNDFLDLFYTDDATNPNWTYITTLAPSITGAQVLSTTFTLPSGGSLQAVRANFLYRGAPTPCSGGSDNFDDHDDLVFAVGSGATQSIQLLLEEFGPSSSQLAAVDSMLLLRDPFPVVNGANLLNLGLDRNTRVIIYATNLQLTQGETSASVVVNLIDSSGLSYDIAAEDVRPVPNSNFTQLIFRLPNNLPVGTCTIKVKAHGQVSNAGTIRIRT